MDIIKKKGGARLGAGRKPKAEEQKLIERLTPLTEYGYKALEKALIKEQSWAVKLFFEYMYGKPKQQIEQTTTRSLNDFDIKSIYNTKEEE